MLARSKELTKPLRDFFPGNSGYPEALAAKVIASRERCC